MSFIALLVAGFAILLNRSLKERVDQLEARIRELTARPTPTAPQIPTAQPIPTPQTPASANPGALHVAPEAANDPIIEWFKENWLIKLGALLLLIGFGWLVSYAFLNNWIGPAGRIALGMGGGALIALIGVWRMRVSAAEGGVFVVLGATVLLLSTYGARSIYGFFTPESALIFMFLVSAGVAYLSGVYNSKQLAITSVLMAGVAPLLTDSPTHAYIPLFSYLFFVVLGAVWIVLWKDFREVVLAALLVVACYSVPVLSGADIAERTTLVFFMYGFAAVFYLMHTAGLMRLKGEESAPDVTTAFGNALLLAVWIFIAAPHDARSIILLGWAAAFLTGAFVVYRAVQRSEPLYIYAGVGLAYIAAATALEVDGAALTLAYTFEAAALSFSIFAITRNVAVAQRAALALAGPVLLSITSIMSSEWNHAVFNKDFFVLAALMGVFFFLGGTYWEEAQKTGSADVKNGNALLLIIGSVYGYILVWLSLHAAMPQAPDTAVMISLFVYTVIGISTYLGGSAENDRILRVYGGTLLGFVVARLLIVDVWQMALSGRIITFFLIGTLLMATAFLQKRPAQKTDA